MASAASVVALVLTTWLFAVVASEAVVKAVAEVAAPAATAQDRSEGSMSYFPDHIGQAPFCI